MSAEQLLFWLLRVSASILFLAFPCMLLPESWMDATHRWLGLGSLPEAPIMGYLTRSLAGFYGFFGVLTWMLTSDLVRYRPLIVAWGWFHILFGGMLLAIDIHAGLPSYWIAIEGPGLIGAGLLTLFLVSRVPTYKT